MVQKFDCGWCQGLCLVLVESAHIVRGDFHKLHGTDGMVLYVVRVKTASIDPGTVADGGSCFLKPRFQSEVDSNVGRADSLLTILQRLFKCCFSFALGFAVEVLPFVRSILVFPAPSSVFSLEYVAIRTQSGVLSWCQEQEKQAVGRVENADLREKRRGSPSSPWRLHSFGL